MFLSIVIPAYNARNTIIPLLESILSSRKVDFSKIEIIVVDDKSNDVTAEVSLTFLRTHSTRFARSGQASHKLSVYPERKRWAQKANFPAVTFRVILLKSNQGPAKARNIGVKYAKGKVVLFLDADVLVYRNTLYEIVRSFESDPDLYALTGVWDKKQKSNKFFPKFKALRDWSYWINERDPKNYYYLFSTRIAAIKRDLFLRLGGFDTTYKAALVEDMELTYRIAKRYAVVFNQKVIVHHEFEDFHTVAKKYFWRSFYWSKIYRSRKKFDPVATTSKEAITTISAAGFIGSFFLLLVTRMIIQIGQITKIEPLENLLQVICIMFLVIHLWGVRKFLFFVAQEEGIIFGIKSFITGLILYIVILSGAAVSFVYKRN